MPPSMSNPDQSVPSVSKRRLHNILHAPVLWHYHALQPYPTRTPQTMSQAFCPWAGVEGQTPFKSFDGWVRFGAGITIQTTARGSGAQNLVIALKEWHAEAVAVLLGPFGGGGLLPEVGVNLIEFQVLLQILQALLLQRPSCAHAHVSSGRLLCVCADFRTKDGHCSMPKVLFARFPFRRIEDSSKKKCLQCFPHRAHIPQPFSVVRTLTAQYRNDSVCSTWWAIIQSHAPISSCSYVVLSGPQQLINPSRKDLLSEHTVATGTRPQ